MNRGILVSATAFLAAVCFMLPATAQINEGFDLFQVGIRPAGWEFIGCDRNSDADMDFFGDAAPGIKLGRIPRSKIVTREYTRLPGDSDLSFYIRAVDDLAGNPSSALLVREFDADLPGWSRLTWLDGPFTTSGDVVTLALNASSSQRVDIEFLQAAGDGNLVVDDVAITNVEPDPVVPPEPGPLPDYLVVARDDYTGDGTTDIAVYNRPSGDWRIFGEADVTFGGGPFDVPVPGDYNGDGVADLAYFDRQYGRWYAQSAPGQWIHNGVFWGESGDIPVPGDYSGDGTTDLAVWRPSTGWWYVRGVTAVQWGWEGMIPVPGTYTQTDKTQIAIVDPAVFRPTFYWYVLDQPARTWGLPGDILTPGDYFGDGYTELSTWRPANQRFFYVEHPFVNWTWGVWGQLGDVPVVGDFDGDGTADITVFRAPDQWLIRDIGAETFAADLDDDLVVTGAPGY